MAILESPSTHYDARGAERREDAGEQPMRRSEEPEQKRTEEPIIIERPEDIVKLDDKITEETPVTPSKVT